MKKIFWALFFNIFFITMAEIENTKNMKPYYILNKQMYNIDYENNNFDFLENKSNYIITKKELKELTNNILFNMEKPPINALFYASKKGSFILNNSNVNRIFTLCIYIIDLPNSQNQLKQDALFKKIDSEIEKFLLEQTNFNLKKIYLKSQIGYEIEEVGFLIKRFDENNCIEITVMYF